MTPNAFDLSRGVGEQIGRGLNAYRGNQQRQRDASAIETILEDASKSGNPQDMNRAFTQILSSVSQEQQPFALQLLQQTQQRLESKRGIQQQQAADVALGFPAGFGQASQEAQKGYNKRLEVKAEKESKPPLTLNESLNQAEHRYKNTTSKLRLPFEKKDAFGNIFIDFEGDETKRGQVLEDLEKEYQRYAKQVADEYRKYGSVVPQDVLDNIRDEIKVKVGEEIVSLDTAAEIQAFSKEFPPEKHKGRSATDSNGNQLISDGLQWTIKAKK